MMGVLRRGQEARRHHRRQRQRHHRRHGDRHRQRHREFAEQPPDDAAHQQQRNQHRNQRNADRHDGEGDFARASERGGERLLALFDIAGDVLEHHDRVVDDEADRNRQRHQRQIVEAVAGDPHQRAGAEQRQRHRDARDDRRPQTAQKDEDHHHHQRDGEQQRELHVLNGGANRLRAVAQGEDVDRGRHRGLDARQLGHDLVDDIDDVGARLLEDDEEDAALAIGPGRLVRVLRAGHRLADIAHPQRRAVAVGDDDVVPIRRPDELIVGVNREGARPAVDRALGLGQRRDRERRAHILERKPFGDELGGIELDADGGLLLAADGHLGDAGDLADLLGELGLDIVVDLGQRQEFRGRGEQENGRIRRIHLAISRRTRQILRQLPAGGVDRRLDIGRGRVDVAVEVELDGDGGRAERARRRHLRDAGDLRELRLERLGDRGGHGVGTGAGELGGNLNGGEIDLRQRRDRQSRISDDADEQDADHQQRGGDGMPNERLGDAARHVRAPSRARSARTRTRRATRRRGTRRARLDQRALNQSVLARRDHGLAGRQTRQDDRLAVAFLHRP